MKVMISLVSFAVVVAGVAPFARAEDVAPSIAPTRLHARLQGEDAPQIIDVRTAAEYATGHLPGAVNIPHTELAGRLAEVNADHGVVLYCMVGPRARKAEQTLRDAGVNGLLHLEGGMAAWLGEGFAAQTSEP